MVEFPSYDDAMRNSNDLRTTAFSQRLMALASGPPAFRNLDVLSSQDL